MTPETLDIQIKRGASLDIEIECFQSDGTTPLDISSWGLSGDIQATPSGGVLQSMAIGCKAGTTNAMTIALSSTLCAALPTTGDNFTETETYYYDIKNDTGSEIEYIFQGKFEVIPTITD